MKQYIHIIGPLFLWVIAFILFVVTITDDIPKRIDSVKTYQLQKKPHSFQDAWYNVKDSFDLNWQDDTCYTLTNFTTNADCLSKRSTLSTNILTFMECTKYSSQMCNCISNVVQGIKSPTSSTGKDLGGKKDATIYAIESCRWLMHNAHTAVSTGKIWAQKTAVLLLIFTLVTGNAFDWVVMNWLLQNYKESMSKAVCKMVVILFWSMVGLIITVVSDNNTYLLFILVLIPPIIILALYESYIRSAFVENKPFIHPYYFTCILGALTLLAHSEAGILDFDEIVFEIIKCNVAGYIYLQVVWKYMLETTTSSSNNTKQYDSRFVEDATLRGVILVGILYVVGLMAPYAKYTFENLIWYTPFVWVLIGFVSITWICAYDLDEPNPKKENYHQYVIKPASKYVSAIQMVFMLILLLYYLRENSTVYRVLIDRFPPNSIQYNTSIAWQRA